MNKILFVYDDIQKPGRDILQIIGEKSYGDILYKKKTNKCRSAEILNKYEFIMDVIQVPSIDRIPCLIEKLDSFPASMPVFHLFSDCIISNLDEFDTLINKTRYIKQNVCILSPLLVGIMFHNTEDYILYLKNSHVNSSTKKLFEGLNYEHIRTDAFTNINNSHNFLKYITGGFDARFFNEFSGDDYIVTKKSSDIRKIKNEYTYFQLLPEQMRMWFVMPFHYQESDGTASYSMERYHVPDLAIRWVHRSIPLDEFETILKKVFYFVGTRSSRPIAAAEYRLQADSLYLNKLDARIHELKKNQYYEQFRQFISAGTEYESLDEIVDQYKKLYKAAFDKTKFKPVSVIGHGDLCFSNMLYDKEASIFKLIDPKGACVEQDLWTDPYYDIAKLSHSICGRYDFFNSGLYDVALDSDLSFKLSIDFDNSPYISLFKNYLSQYGFDYACTRLFEASLFLSMLPLHMDYPQKVFGFLLNALNIMKEVRTCLKI